MGLVSNLPKFQKLWSKIFLISMTFTLVNCNQKVQFESIKSSEKLDTPDIAIPDDQVNPPVTPQPNSHTETFSFHAESSKIDILFVVDNSPSMYDEQTKLGKRLESFIGSLRNIDWQIGITTTDVSDGKYGLKGDLLQIYDSNTRVLTNKEADFSKKFLKTVTRDETKSCSFNCPSSDEQPLKAINLAIEKAQTRNYDLFRSDADFVAIVLSDEDERSTGPSSATHPEEVIKKVSQLLPGKMFTTYGVILEPGDTKCYQDQGNGEYGDFVYDLVKKTGGKTSSVCAKDYGQGLKEIGERVSTIANSIQLAHEPIPGSISLEVIPHVALNYEINGNKIIFTSAPPSGSEIKVTYLEK